MGTSATPAPPVDESWLLAKCPASVPLMPAQPPPANKPEKEVDKCYILKLLYRTDYPPTVKSVKPMTELT